MSPKPSIENYQFDHNTGGYNFAACTTHSEIAETLRLEFREDSKINRDCGVAFCPASAAGLVTVPMLKSHRCRWLNELSPGARPSKYDTDREEGRPWSLAGLLVDIG